MNAYTEADAAYDRGWRHCLDAIIELSDKHTNPALSAVLRELRDTPPTPPNPAAGTTEADKPGEIERLRDVIARCPLHAKAHEDDFVDWGDE